MHFSLGLPSNLHTARKRSISCYLGCNLSGAFNSCLVWLKEIKLIGYDMAYRDLFLYASVNVLKSEFDMEFNSKLPCMESF